MLYLYANPGPDLAHNWEQIDLQGRHRGFLAFMFSPQVPVYFKL